MSTLRAGSRSSSSKGSALVRGPFAVLGRALAGGAGRQGFRLPRSPWGRLALLGVGLVVVLTIAGNAAAAPPTFTNPCSGSSDAAMCERLTFIANSLQQFEDDRAGGLPISGNVGVQGIGGAAVGVHVDNDPLVTTNSGETSVAGTVALSEGDQNRFDLIWWGVWFLCGFTFAASVSARAWRHYKGWG